MVCAVCLGLNSPLFALDIPTGLEAIIAQVQTQRRLVIVTIRA